jgi:circadian clock protein KaiC
LESIRLLEVGRTITGIKGFDTLVGGGIPRRSLVILIGNPGTGKTTLGAQFLYNGSIKYEERGLYVSLMEDKKKFLNNMAKFGFDFEPLERKGIFKIVNYSVFSNISDMFDDLSKLVDSFNPQRAVVDSITALLMSSEGRTEVQAGLYALLSKLSTNSDCTTLAISEIPSGSTQPSLGVEEFLADGLIIMHNKIRGKAKVKGIEVRKMRGTQHFTQTVLYGIDCSGITVDTQIDLSG